MDQPDEQSRALLAAIVDSSEDAIISKNLDGIITSWNKGAEEIFGYTVEEAVGQPISMLIPPERLNEEPKILERIRNGERIRHFETIRRTKNGTFLEISLTVSPIFNQEGKVIGASKIARDITERKEAEEALASAKKRLQGYAEDLERQVQERTHMLEKTVAELETFSYSLSHDMRAPLRAIGNFLQIVLSDHGGTIGTEATNYIQRAIITAQRMDKLVVDVLAFTQLSRTPMSIEPVDVEKLLRGIIAERNEFQPPRAGIKIEAPLLWVAGNEASLTQCITNLLDNAVKFMAPDVKPQVRIYTERQGDQVRLWLEDNGIGIDADGRKRLFQMCQRIHASAYPGTGIGLAIVRKAAERMGGEVGVESEPGKGSRFWVQLPGVKP
jgi:PAS domain S-box-containing protein